MNTADNRGETPEKVQYDMLANVSHGVRTPIHTIMGMTQLALEDARNPEAVEKYLRKIKSAGNLLMSQINELLEITRIEKDEVELKLDPCTAHDLYEQIVTLTDVYGEDKNIHFQIDVSNMSQATFFADKVKLEQIFSNLISNAVKYSRDGGMVSFTGETICGTEREITNRYTIKDNGIGIDSEFQKQMFLPFTREQNDVTVTTEGTGLGLYIVEQLVKLMHGRIQVQSGVGEGTSFQIELTSKTSSLNSLPGMKKKEDLKLLWGKRILLCEDNALNAEMTKELLENAGILVDSVCNGQEAVEKVRNTEEYYYDAILMDIRMPVMDGLEATRQIRQIDREDTYVIPIVALTANAYDEDYKKSLAAGMDAHLTKPFEIRTLLQQLTKFWRVYKE